MIQENQIKKLNSLLNRFKKKLTIDHIVLTKGTFTQLITDLKELLQKYHLQYDILKNKRKYGFDDINSE